MHDLMVLLYPFRLWQVFSLSPFGLSQKSMWPKESMKLKLFAICWLLIHFLAIIYGFLSISSYVNPHYSVLLRYNTIISLLISRLLACAVVLEAILKRKDQITFFESIKQIDFILKYKLQIRIDYRKYQYENNIATFAWFFIYLAMEIFVFVRVLTKQRYAFTYFWIYNAIPTLISSLLCLQITTYVHTIRHRYEIINDFLRKIILLQSKGSVSTDNLKAIRHVRFIHEEIPSYSSTKVVISCEQFEQIRRAYQLLYDLSMLVNKLYWWSLPLYLGNYFHKVLAGSFNLCTVVLAQSQSDPYSMLAWTTFCVAQFIILAHACQALSIEVRIFLIRSTIV